MQSEEKTKQVDKMEVKKRSAGSTVLVQVISFLMLGKLELLEFHWLGITELGHLIKAMWIKLFHIKLSGFLGI